MNVILFDGNRRNHLLPLTFTRPVADIRIGILTIREKWEQYFGKTSSITEDYLSGKFPVNLAADNILINSSVCPNEDLVKKIKELKTGEALIAEHTLIAVALPKHKAEAFKESDTDCYVKHNYSAKFLQVNNLWDIFQKNAEAIEADFKLLTKGRKSAKISSTNTLINPENIFVEEGAKVEASVINASTGCVYIAKDAEVMEGSLIRGPFALCEHSTLKMGAKIYGATTIGPHSKVGGEVNNSVIFGYSNKAHDGFLGNAVIGEWCNLGADSNNSNLKNNYAEVKLWNYAENTFVSTGSQFCGLIMGDHSKCGINTMFNTGTVVGVSCNIFGAGFPRNFVPSFSWGGANGFMIYSLDKALETAKLVMERRHIELTKEDEKIFEHITNLKTK
jgi:UDP-N-acetylglucosamine diphosphorylase/glucosamine-1-phosphate N-acetyltransferase